MSSDFTGAVVSLRAQDALLNPDRSCLGRHDVHGVVRSPWTAVPGASVSPCGRRVIAARNSASISMFLQAMAVPE